jgi:endonuclease G
MKNAAKNMHINQSENPYEIKYHHFSIIMNAKRLMAFFTAVNIDGSKWILVDRSTGEPSVESEAAEVWYEDPRINSTDQCHQDLYDHQRPRTFDRGHLVRRVDPNWGYSYDARKANADTFHFTNCTPQQWAFNEQVKYWAGIENYVLDNAKAELQRVSVFTGPVFTDSDPPYRYVKVPEMFWKILIRVEQGKLLATALLADQSKLLKPDESFSDLSKVAEYQTSVREIERLTGLDFGSLRDYDTFKQGPETLSASKVKLESFNQINL